MDAERICPQARGSTPVLLTRVPRRRDGLEDQRGEGFQQEERRAGEGAKRFNLDQ